MPLKLLSLFALGVWAEPGLKARRLSNWQAVEEFHRLQHIATKEIQLVAAGLGTAERRQAAEDAASARLAEVGDANLDQLWSSLRTSQGLVALSTNHLQLTAAITALQKEAPQVSQKNILLQKRSLLQEDLVQVLFQSLGVEKDFYKEQNLELKRLWHLKDNSLLWGIELVSLPELSSVCSLHQQLHVGEYWSKLSRATEAAHVDATALYLADQVDKYLQHVISSLEGTSCDLHEPPDVWRRGVEEISNFRRYTQKSAFVLLELVWAFTSGDDPDVIKGFELSLSNTVRESTRSLQQCLKGSPQEMIPPPPTQELVNSLTLLLHEWEALEEMLSLKVQYQDFSVDKIADFLTKISTDIEHLENEIGEGYLVSVDLDNLKQPYMATRQVTFLYELAVQAMWLSLGDTAVNRTDRFEHIVHHWEDSHTALLQGGVAAASTLPLPATTNFCSLSAMAIAHQDFDSFRETFIQLYSAKDTLNLLKDSVVNEASNPSLAEAFAAFKDAWTSFRTTDELRSHDLLIAYHHANPSAFGSKHNLDYAEGPEDYHQVHKVYHKLYRSILQERNYDDIFFLDLEGNCIYSVYKEVDFSTNFAQNGAGLWKDSGLGAAFTAALQAPSQIHVVDWQAYGPSNGELASFIATGIFRGDELLGVFCIRLPPASQPVSLAETEKKMSIAKASMTEAADTYLLTGPTCTKSVPESAWELALQRLTRLSYLTLRLQTEFTLDEYYSQLWLDKAAAGNAAQKASLARTADSQVAQALLAFKNAFQAYRPTDEERLLSLQIKYILTNDNPPGEKAKLDYAEGNEAYHAVHKMYHPTYRALLQSEHYYDIFFFDPDGNCIYSVSKEPDFATNFAAQGSGEWKDSGLGDAYRAALQNPTSVNYIDWRPYGPSDGAPASFLSIAVHSSAGDLIGVLATQLPPNLLPRNSSLLLETGIAEVKELLWKFRYGSLSEGIHAPATQPIADALPSEGMWQEFAAALQAGDGSLVRQRGDALVAQIARLEPLLVAGAATYAPAVSGAKISLAGEQLALLQRLTGEAVNAASSDSVAIVTADIATFEANLQVLTSGSASRRLATQTISATDSVKGLSLLSKAEEAWTSFKAQMEDFLSLTPNEQRLKEVIDLSDNAIAAMGNVHEYFSTATRTTTLMPVEVLTPVPFTGIWAAGRTFLVAVKLAEALINEDQVILPGYELKHDIFDDQCDGGKGSDIVVSKKVAKDSYVGVAGMGCNSVCEQVSTLAVSLKLPFLSFDCSAERFSDEAAFPFLARLGTKTSGFAQAMQGLKDLHGWSDVFLVSGDASVYQEEANRYKASLQGMGLRVTYLSALESAWQEIHNLMATIKEATKAKHRILLVLGTETFFRKLICASLTAQLQQGIVWISAGTWRQQWWQRSDMSTSFQRQWLTEAAHSLQLKAAFRDFTTAWKNFRPLVNDTRSTLISLYATDQKDALVHVEGPEAYHEAHVQWHPLYRSLLFEKEYYDIFFFNLDGDLIYSTFKESDFGTNFALNGTGPWKDSGLGEAFRAALASPDAVSYVDWKPYGPSANADAAFFSIGVRDVEEELVGVYAIQLPPSFEKSVEELHPQCSLEAISAAYEGAINVAGLGKAAEADMEKPLDCFKGHSPRSLLTLLDRHLARGFPEGDAATQVEDPYNDVKAQAVDGACALALTVQHILQQGYTMYQVQHPDAALFGKITDYLHTKLDFQGVSGRVTFQGNDRLNPLVVQQVQQGSLVEVGLIDGDLQLTDQLTDAAWVPEAPAKVEYMWVVQVGVLVTVILCPCIAGIWLGRRILKRAGQSTPANPVNQQ